MSIQAEVSLPELLRQLTAITREVRLSGSPEEARAFDHIENELIAWGYTVNRYLSDALIGFPLHSSLTVVSPEPIELPCNGYSLSPKTGPAGVTARIVGAGAGHEADYDHLDVHGAIVLTDGLAMPAKTLAAARAGAIGHIHINDEHTHEMCLSPVWGTPVPETAGLLPAVPSVGITRADGDRLKAMLATGTVTVRLVTEPFRQWTRIPCLTADLAGSDGDEFILFSGHVDSWHLGVMDNGTANAAQLEVARLLATRRQDLRRGIRLAFWSGHSHGRYASSAWYADTFWRELHARCVCHVNIDSVGAIGATVLEEVAAMADTYEFGREVLRDTVGVELDYRRISRSSDQSFWGHGIPTLWASLSEQPRDDSATGSAMAALLGAGGKAGGLGWWWHTPEDTFDKIDPEHLVRDCRVYAETLWRLCTLERLPFDPSAGAAEMADAIERYHAAAGGAIDLCGTAALARESASAIRSALDRITDPTRANRFVQGIQHWLIPVNYTRLGPFEHDLALRCPCVPGLSDAGELAKLAPESDAFHFLRTKLIRERNRVEHALSHAKREADAAR